MNELKITEYKDIRVLTTQQIAEQYDTDTQVITNNFNRNKDRYKEGKHYICLTGEDKKIFINKNQNDFSSFIKAKAIYLWTEKGCLLHAKSLGTDEAWEVYERLVDFYFNKKKPLTAIEQLQLTQQAVLEVKGQIDAVSKDLQDFKEDLPVLGCDIDKLQYAKNRKVVPLLGGKESEAYKDKSLRSKVYSDIGTEIRRQFGVPNQKCLKRNQLEQAIAVIQNYELPIVLQEKIEDLNAQISF